MAKKYRSVKAKLREMYDNNLSKTNDLFENIYRRSQRTARRLYNFGKNKEFKNIGKRTEVFFADELYYSNTGFSYNKMLGSEDVNAENIVEVFSETEMKIYIARTENFFNKNGDNTFKYNGVELTLDEWLEKFKNKEITKDDMNKIIKEFKELNPDRSEHYRDSNENNNDLAENGFVL